MQSSTNNTAIIRPSQSIVRYTNINSINAAVILFRDVEHSGISSAPGISSNNSGIRQL